NVPEKITRPEINVLIITGTMMALWVSSSWIAGINVMVVALLGACVMCIPQLKTLDFETFLNNIGWDPIFLSAAVLSLGDLMVSNGVSALITSLLPTLHVSTPILIAFSASLFFAILLIIPHGPSLVIIMAAPLMTLAINAGSSPAILILVAAYCANCSYLIPLDTVTLLSYCKGYYSIKDIFISSLPLQAFLVIVLSLWLAVMGSVMGFL
ncbi:MAG: hypothetical protein FWF04_04970, partial [Clostridiales bacterium]|nr:hypothetical protein [Clostridiales bacterium]